MFIEIDPTLTERVNRLQEQLEKDSEELKKLREKAKKEQEQELKRGRIESYLKNRDKHDISYMEKLRLKQESPDIYDELYSYKNPIPKTKAEFDQLTYNEKILLYSTNREIYTKFNNM